MDSFLGSGYPCAAVLAFCLRLIIKWWIPDAVNLNMKPPSPQLPMTYQLQQFTLFMVVFPLNHRTVKLNSHVNRSPQSFTQLTGYITTEEYKS